jgi:hypothetical protein
VSESDADNREDLRTIVHSQMCSHTDIQKNVQYMQIDCLNFKGERPIMSYDSLTILFYFLSPTKIKLGGSLKKFFSLHFLDVINHYHLVAITESEEKIHYKEKVCDFSVLSRDVIDRE